MSHHGLIISCLMAGLACDMQLWGSALTACVMLMSRCLLALACTAAAASAWAGDASAHTPPSLECTFHVEADCIAASLCLPVLGAGVGKGRTIAGLVLENLRCERKRHIWISIGSDLRVDARRDLDDVGAKDVAVHALNKLPYAALDSEKASSA